MKKKFFSKVTGAIAVLALVTIPNVAVADSDMPWLDSNKTAQERADLLVNAMNEDQLIHMLHGQGMLTGGQAPGGGPHFIGYIPPIPELKVPAFVMSDGPSGLRNGEPATQMPAPIVQASTWDTVAAHDYGQAIGQDAKDRGQDLLFGPGFNLARNPLGGRTFEYFGEDPLLSGRLASANVQGMQGVGIMSTLKHYVANNQDLNRTLASMDIDERTLHEIYEKPFRIAIHGAEPATVMCSYNKVNGDTACGSDSTLIKDLRQTHGFKGLVLTDYPAAWSPTDIRDGLNIELPWSFWTSPERIRSAIANGEMTWDVVRLRVKETLVQMFRFGLFDHDWDSTRGDRVRDMKEIPAARGNAVALKVAQEGAVLMKNDGALPLGKDLKHVLVVGNAAKSQMSGGGSSNTKAIESVSTLDAIKKRLPDSEVSWVSEWNPAGIAIKAPKADVVIVVATQQSSELLDRLSLDFNLVENNAVNIAASNNKNTVVVTQVGGPVLMPWLKDVRAVLNVWYPGQAGGEATAGLLFGEVNPSGRLPLTFPAAGQKALETSDQYPGANGGFNMKYTEGVFMGYRWFNEKNVEPAFTFGSGLSYTTFHYSNVAISQDSGSRSDSFKVSVDVTNTGSRAGAVTPQFYVGKPKSPGLQTPPKELVGFDKVTLQPGETKTVTVTVGPEELNVWDVNTHSYIVLPGAYKVFVADSVNDIKGTAEYTVK
ncbi:beta-glucosidase family protein [Arcanobacterium ihumii]|uniref:beta-glucosidase family protein n=1 Tax=Arcanobacterium ihumii TaxID=2138162 RepID=UPI000F5238ED|nr:glycoside hydrolase family 3 C-terminal domain-containing protein [Arcanobacterium ihumii]